MPSLETLPTELLLQIAEEGEQKSLASLSLVCRRLSSIAQRVLYRSVDLSSHELHQTQQVGRLVRTIFERPDLGEKIRSLQLTAQEYPLGQYLAQGLSREDMLFLQSRSEEHLRSRLFEVSEAVTYAEAEETIEKLLAVWMRMPQGLLLTLLPNIKRFELDTVWTDPQRTQIPQPLVESLFNLPAISSF